MFPFMSEYAGNFTASTEVVLFAREPEKDELSVILKMGDNGPELPGQPFDVDSPTPENVAVSALDTMLIDPAQRPAPLPWQTYSQPYENHLIIGFAAVARQRAMRWDRSVRAVPVEDATSGAVGLQKPQQDILLSGIGSLREIVDWPTVIRYPEPQRTLSALQVLGGILEAKFTIPQLREVIGGIWGKKLDPRNFAKQVGSLGLVRLEGESASTGGRDAQLWTMPPSTLD
jgi:hypothetical protein